MSIQLNENIKIASPNPIDGRYFSPIVIAGRQQPYTGVTHVNSLLDIGQDRYSGLTVNINSVEYWYKDGITDTDLIIKKYDQGDVIDDFISGVTNLGFFSGKTGIQTLNISTPLFGYEGRYESLYNYYYRDGDGIVRIGTPGDDIPKRGYVKTSSPIRSFVWNERVDDGERVGWILTDDNIINNIGLFVSGIKYYGSSALTTTKWSDNDFMSVSNLSVRVDGDLDVGTGLVIGGPIYNNIEDGIINLRTLKSKNENTLKITNDDYFVYLSGNSGTGSNIGGGVSILSGITNNDFKFRTISGSGDTTVSLSNNNDEIIIYSSGASLSYDEGFGIDIINNTISVESGLFVPSSTYDTYVNTVQPIIDSSITGATNGLTKVPNNLTGRNVQLGGTLSQDTSITGTQHDFTLSTKNICLISKDSINIVDGSGVGGINIESDGGKISLVGNSISQEPITKLDVSENLLKITDNRSGSTQVGVVYDSCYHGNYVNRSLVDKEYVDDLVSTGTGAVTGATNVGFSGGTEVFKQLNSEREFEYRKIIGSGDTTVNQSGDTIIVHSVASGTTFLNDIDVSIEVGKTFGRYINGDTIPAAGKTPKEVLLMALKEPLEPTVNLSSSGNAVIFGDTGKTVNLNFGYVINSDGASVSSVLLEYRRGESWTVLTTDTGATTYTHSLDDSGDRFNTTTIEYRYTVIDSEGATGNTTYNVDPQPYTVPTYSPIYKPPSIYGYETENNREKGNIQTNINGNISSNRDLVNIIGYDIQRCVNNGSWSTLYTCNGINDQNINIATCLDIPSPSNANSVGYRIRVCDEYCTTSPNVSPTYTINFGFASYHGYSPNHLLSNSQLLGLGNQCMSTSKNRTIEFNSPITDYTFYVYPESFGVLNSIIMNGAAPILGSFTYSSENIITNNYSVDETYLVYVTNATNAFTDDEVEFS